MLTKNHQLRNSYPILLFLAILIISCNAAKNSVKTEKAITLSDISDKPTEFEGKEVKLEGVYLGWKHGECKYPLSFISKQITRSDWAFSDGKWCCFVTGSNPVGLKSSPEKPIAIVLTALIKLKDSKVYLQYISVQVK